MALLSNGIGGMDSLKEDDTKILRFCRAERLVHWAIATPFLICLGTALVLLLVYNPEPTRPGRALFWWAHRLSGVFLIILPPLAVYRSRGSVRIHFYNIKQAWTWVIDDFKWLAVLLTSVIRRKAKLPDQGKFNAAEKINFMVLLATYPLYVATGLLLWLTDVAFFSWVLHVFMAILALPLILGHLYMALIARSGRPGLSGMSTGFVPREWAKHHYTRWYYEHYQETELAVQESGELSHCQDCAGTPQESDPGT